MLTKFFENECVLAAVNLTDEVKAGDIGTVCQVYDDRTYLVDFDYKSSRIIDVKEEDLVPYEG